jgi:hypothetical protein
MGPRLRLTVRQSSPTAEALDLTAGRVGQLALGQAELVAQVGPPIRAILTSRRLLPFGTAGVVVVGLVGIVPLAGLAAIISPPTRPPREQLARPVRGVAVVAAVAGRARMTPRPTLTFILPPREEWVEASELKEPAQMGQGGLVASTMGQTPETAVAVLVALQALLAPEAHTEEGLGLAVQGITGTPLAIPAERSLHFRQLIPAATARYASCGAAGGPILLTQRMSNDEHSF